MKWRESKQGQLATEASKLSSNGNHSLALSLLELALEHSPKDQLVLVYYGRVLHALGRDKEAEHSLREAVAIRSDLCYPWSELGLLLKDCKRFGEAAECFQKSAQLHPDASTFTLLAELELSFDADSSFRNAMKALELDPNWDEAIQIAARAKAAIAKSDEAGNVIDNIEDYL